MAVKVRFANNKRSATSNESLVTLLFDDLRLILDIASSRRGKKQRCNCEKVIPNERSFPFGVTLAPVTLHFVRNFDVTKFLFKIPRHAIGMNLSGEGESSAVSFMVE